MDATTSNLESLAVRVERLERESRLFRRGGIVLFLLCATLVVMGQARPPHSVDAQSFVLRDASGNKRAELTVVNDNPMLTFLDVKGVVSVRISPASLELTGPTGNVILNENSFLVQDYDGHRVFLSNGASSYFSLSSSEKGAEATISLVRNPDGLRLNVIDAHKFRTIIGNTGLQMPSTGESRTTSAASIIMFNDKDDLIWRAPAR